MNESDIMEESNVEEKEILALLERVPIKDYFLLIAQSARLAGEFAKKLGEFQKTEASKLLLMKPTMEIVKTLGMKIIRELDAGKIGPLLKLSLEPPPTVSPDFFELSATTAEEKIAVGEKFIDFATRIEELLE